jgi:RNA polymerase sigma-70 factor, ECF subfamily
MSDPDAALIAACARREDWAFRRLIERHGQAVYALCTALAGTDGEDLAQETFLRVLRAVGDFDAQGPATLRSWILTIARRLCHDRARHLGCGVEVASPAPGAWEPADPALGPEEHLEAARLCARLSAALAQLPLEQRAVIALREWEGLGYEEIATIEDVPIGTVRSRLARARSALREALGGQAGEKEARTHRVAPAR